ncbi:MAG: aminotransferase class I/II-fold pyridoxal phosphate-dependent enzyme, partial [Planctomycetota bacterium]|nr:aminotransferase class I/II-fold pyridoxal phosphate-dependent enzyme [Planctomycetota bacterium]
MAEEHAALFAAELQSLRDRDLSRTTDDPTRGVDFTSNDYLGLAQDPRVVEAAVRALQEHGAGAAAARLLAGPLPSHDAAEEAAATWLSAEAALLLPSGYHANAALVGALAGRGDVLVSDALVHASLIDAARASRARVEVHAHLDLDEIEHRLATARGARRRILLTEGVFSMDGTAAPLAALCEICARHDAWLVVDEAHSAGLLGPCGAGAVAEAAAAGARVDRMLARVVTGGKALGVSGAFIVGSRSLRELIVHRGRAFIFSTAPSPAVAAALTAAIGIAAAEDERRERCLDAAREIARGLELPTPDGAIVPWVIGGNRRTLALAER